MKTIGLIGGLSAESTAEYYKILNQIVRQRLGPLHNARCLIVSVDFADFDAMMREGRWDDAAHELAEAARSLERGGADFFLLCTNTFHKLAVQIASSVRIPFLHIADAAAQAICAAGLRRVGLLGTRFTMQETFYRARLAEKFGLDVLIPDAEQCHAVDRIIFDELVKGVIRDESREVYSRILHDLARRGAEGVLLGCTEIGLLVSPADSPVPLFDTTRLHAEAAVDSALQPSPSKIP